MKFIVDTGECILIIPTFAVNGIILNPTPVCHSTANAENIKYYEQAILETWILSSKKSFTWTFVITNITNSLLRLDFLKNFGLIINCKNNTTYDLMTAQKKTLKLS